MFFDFGWAVLFTNDDDNEILFFDFCVYDSVSSCWVCFDLNNETFDYLGCIFKIRCREMYHIDCKCVSYWSLKNIRKMLSNRTIWTGK